MPSGDPAICPPDAPWSAVLRPRGAGRWLQAAFTAAFLVPWALLEGLALFLVFLLGWALLAGLGAVPRPGGAVSPGAVALLGLFGLVWGLGWSAAGLSLLRDLFWALWGEDRIHVGPAGLEAVRHAPPLSRRKVFARHELVRVRLQPGGQALVVDTTRGSETLTVLGDELERARLRDRIEASLCLGGSEAFERELRALPEGWDVDLDSDSRTLLVPARRVRRAQARTSWIAATLFGLGFVAATRDEVGPAAVALGLLALLATALGSWLRWARTEWEVEPGRLVFRRRFAGRLLTEKRFAEAKLVVVVGDSDGEYLQLRVRAGDRVQTLAAAHGEPQPIEHLGRWLSHRAKLPLELPPGWS